MSRAIGWALVALTAPLAAAAAGAQTIVPVHEEPRHHLAHEGPGLQILDVQIPPGDTTLFHTHDAPIAYVAISPSPVNTQVLQGEWGNVTGAAASPFSIGRVTWNESYARSPVTHRVTTVGSAPFRLIAVINRGPGDAGEGAPSLGSAGSVEGEGRWFRSAHDTIASMGTLQWEGYDRTVVVVQVSEGRLTVASPGESGEELAGAGDFAVFAPGREYRVHNPGPGPVTLTFVEVR